MHNTAPLIVRGDSPQCGEMSHSDRGDGHRLGAVAFMRLRGRADTIRPYRFNGIFIK